MRWQRDQPWETERQVFLRTFRFQGKEASQILCQGGPQFRRNERCCFINRWNRVEIGGRRRSGSTGRNFVGKTLREEISEAARRVMANGGCKSVAEAKALFPDDEEET